MPRYHRLFDPGHLQFITSSTYRRAPVFNSKLFCQIFAEVLSKLRQEFGFRLVGWVLMPDHFHLLIQPWPAESAPRLIQQLKQRTAYRLLQILRENPREGWCRKMLARFRLPATVHDQAQYRVWQRRYYVMNIFTEKKRLEKLHYMHGNPVKRGLVASPAEWPWSSFRFYYLEDVTTLVMDQLD
jgi:putative transposase